MMVHTTEENLYSRLGDILTGIVINFGEKP